MPYELHDLFAVVINNIHCFCELNLKLIIDGDQLWATATLGFPTEEVNSTRYNIEESHLNESLLKTQTILSNFLSECK